MGTLIAGNAVSDLLDTAWVTAMTRINNQGDNVIDHGIFELIGPTGLLLRVSNSNNHQITYGVMGAACMALVQYMTTTAFGAATFHIFDGVTEVGKGEIS